MTPSNRMLRVGTLLLATAALVACGSDAATSPSQTTGAQPGTAAQTAQTAQTAEAPPEACSLLTDEEAAAELGGPAAHVAQDPVDASSGNGTTVTEGLCEYKLVTSDQLGHDIWVAVYTGADRQYFDQTGSVTDNPPIAGIGDAAKGISNHVYAFANDTMVQVYGSVADSNGLQDLTRLVLAKLG